MPASVDPSLRHLLADHHHAVERACRSLLSTSYEDDPQRLVEIFRRFERALLGHFEAERDLLLPAFERVDPGAALAIREDHEALERQLFQLAIEVELHAIRVHAIHHFIAELRAHAAREDATMYRWADTDLPAELQDAMRGRIGESLARLLVRTSQRMPVEVAPTP